MKEKDMSIKRLLLSLVLNDHFLVIIRCNLLTKTMAIILEPQSEMIFSATQLSEHQKHDSEQVLIIFGNNSSLF